jgi:hypothetical protein
MEVVRGMNWERWARASGAAFVVLTVTAFLVGGEAPTVTDSTEDVISYYDGNRGQVLVSSLCFALGLLFFLWFGAAVANLLRESGEGRVGAMVTATTTAFVTVQLVLTGVGASLAYSVAGQGDEGVVKALFDLQWALDLFAALPSAGFFLATSLGLMRLRLAPSWLAFWGIAAAGLFLLRTTNWAREGFWSPTGGYVLILIVVALLWILVTSVVLVRRATDHLASAEQIATPTV